MEIKTNPYLSVLSLLKDAKEPMEIDAIGTATGGYGTPGIVMELHEKYKMIGRENGGFVINEKGMKTYPKLLEAIRNKIWFDATEEVILS